MKKILVTGGAGYIGSVAVKRLIELGHQVTVIDSLYKGKKEFVDKKATFYKVDITDFVRLDKILSKKKFDVIMHFASYKDAGESMIKPEMYYDNITGLMNILKLAPKLAVKKIVFSSSAAVYGEPQSALISENHQCNPTNFYGYTKLVGEQLLEWSRKINKIDYVALRYFNVAGDGGLNYIDPMARNIFNLIGDVLCGRRKVLEVYGNDYKTIDGTGVRDYIHVSDLVEAHIKAINIAGSEIINLGSEKGYSVLQIIKEFEKVTSINVPIKIVKRRVGDVATLIASSKKAKKILKWSAKRNLIDMVKSTWQAYNSI